MIKCIIFDLVGTLYDKRANMLYPDVRSSLRYLNKFYHLFLVTDLKSSKDELIDELGIRDLFSNVIIARKETALFEMIMKENSLRPNECMVVGDGETDELAIADSLNMKSLRVCRDIGSHACKGVHDLNLLEEAILNL